MRHYKEFFKGKVVYCNCDDARESNFFKYFSLNFEHLGLKKLISTGFKADGKGVVLVYEGDKNGNRKVDNEEIVVSELQGNGDFRSAECIEFLKECDVVVTNPPFSLFREYVAQLMEYGKKFLIIGNMNAITYKEIFPYIKNNELWLGMNWIKDFVQPNGEVSKVSEIPMDYEGVMGVPITFLDKYCPSQFEIVGCADADIVPNGWRGMSADFVKIYYAQGNTGSYKEGNRLASFIHNGKAKVPFKRILICHKNTF